MWLRWNTRPIVVRGFAPLPAEVVPGPHVAGNAPFIRARDAVSAPTRGSSAVPVATAAELLMGRPHAVATGVVRPRGRPPPARQAPSEAHVCGKVSAASNPAEVAPLVGRTCSWGGGCGRGRRHLPVGHSRGHLQGDSVDRQLQFGQPHQLVGSRSARGHIASAAPLCVAQLVCVAQLATTPDRLFPATALLRFHCLSAAPTPARAVRESSATPRKPSSMDLACRLHTLGSELDQRRSEGCPGRTW